MVGSKYRETLFWIMLILPSGRIPSGRVCPPEYKQDVHDIVLSYPIMGRFMGTCNRVTNVVPIKSVQKRKHLYLFAMISSRYLLNKFWHSQVEKLNR